MTRTDAERRRRARELTPAMLRALAATVDACAAGGQTTRIVRRTAVGLMRRQLVEPAPEVGPGDYRPTPRGVAVRHEPPRQLVKPKRVRWRW